MKNSLSLQERLLPYSRGIATGLTLAAAAAVLTGCIDLKKDAKLGEIPQTFVEVAAPFLWETGRNHFILPVGVDRDTKINNYELGLKRAESFRILNPDSLHDEQMLAQIVECNIMLCYSKRNRFDEAKASLEEFKAKYPESTLLKGLEKGDEFREVIKNLREHYDVIEARILTKAELLSLRKNSSLLGVSKNAKEDALFERYDAMRDAYKQAVKNNNHTLKSGLERKLGKIDADTRNFMNPVIDSYEQHLLDSPKPFKGTRYKDEADDLAVESLLRFAKNLYKNDNKFNQALGIFNGILRDDKFAKSRLVDDAQFKKAELVETMAKLYKEDKLDVGMGKDEDGKVKFNPRIARGYAFDRKTYRGLLNLAIMEYEELRHSAHIGSDCWRLARPKIEYLKELARKEDNRIR